jgi:drug/metabolite transporter (DMT)-like permease
MCTFIYEMSTKLPGVSPLGRPFRNSAAFAVLAALTFGITTPLVELAGRGVGPFSTSTLLYGGACLSGWLLGRAGRRTSAPRLGRAQLPRLALIAFFGAAVAPTLLAWGLQHAGATVGSLLLNLEAVFTVLLARAFYREPIGARLALALSLMVLAGALLTLDAARAVAWSALGALAVGGATVAWALDNTLTRPLAQQDPLSVVTAKAALGAALTCLLAIAFHEPVPRAGRALALLACGATGYGLSLRLYLLAQRRIGAARTGSIFALAPFVGAAVAWLLGARSAGLFTAVSAGLFGVGVFLQLTERHRHRHLHEPIEHEHPHRHDDGHHDHLHDPSLPPPVGGEHTHRHRHGHLEHEHEHAPDLHHSHRHDR